MPLYSELQQATAKHSSELLSAPIISAALKGAVTRDHYLSFLTEAYHHVKHTVPLLMACGARLSESCEWLRSAVAHYIEEEIGHQEWILNDITAAGGDAEAVRHGRPAMATELMVSYAYDTIARGNPIGFFGMVYVLEGTSVQLASQVAAVLQEKLQLPAKAFSYLTSHGALDLKHIDFFKSLVNRISAAADRDSLLHGARMFFRLYGNVLRSIDIQEQA